MSSVCRAMFCHVAGANAREVGVIVVWVVLACCSLRTAPSTTRSTTVGGSSPTTTCLVKHGGFPNARVVH